MDMQLTKENRELFDKEINPVVQRANGLVVKTQAESLCAQEYLIAIKSTAKAVHEKFDPPVKAAHTAWKAAKELYNFFTQPFDQAEVIIKSKIVAFETEAEKKRQEEARKEEAKRNEAERKRKEELERQAKAAEEKGKTEKADALREKAATQTPIPLFIPPIAEKAKGVCLSKIWKGEVIDLQALCKAIGAGQVSTNLITANQSAINAMAKGVKDMMPIPGIRFYEETQVRASSVAALA